MIKLLAVQCAYEYASVAILNLVLFSPLNSARTLAHSEIIQIWKCCDIESSFVPAFELRPHPGTLRNGSSTHGSIQESVVILIPNLPRILARAESEYQTLHSHSKESLG